MVQCQPARPHGLQMLWILQWLLVGGGVIKRGITAPLKGPAGAAATGRSTAVGPCDETIVATDTQMDASDLLFQCELQISGNAGQD